MPYTIDDLSESAFLDPEYQVSRGWPSSALNQAESGDVHAQLYMGLFASNNPFAQSSSILWYEMAAKQNNLFAMDKMADFYWETKDIPKSCQWMKKIVSAYDNANNQTQRKKIVYIMSLYGTMLLGPLTSDDTDPSFQHRLPENMQDVTEGLRLIERAANLGDADAAISLGDLFIVPNHHPKVDLRLFDGIEWYKKGAKMGNGACAFRLACLFGSGCYCLTMNPRLEHQWLEVAAKLGNVKSQEMLATSQTFSCIHNSNAKKLFSKVKNDKNCELVLGTDETNKCFNPLCHCMDNEDKRFKSCSNCRSTKYCSKECQTAHWKNGHKLECKDFQVEKERTMMGFRERCAPIADRCLVCGKKENETTVLRFCAKCEIPKYCSKECQVKGWKNGHKQKCAWNVAQLKDAQEILDTCEEKEGS